MLKDNCKSSAKICALYFASCLFQLVFFRAEMFNSGISDIHSLFLFFTDLIVLIYSD